MQSVAVVCNFHASSLNQKATRSQERLNRQNTSLEPRNNNFPGNLLGQKSVCIRASVLERRKARLASPVMTL